MYTCDDTCDDHDWVFIKMKRKNMMANFKPKERTFCVPEGKFQ